MAKSKKKASVKTKSLKKQAKAKMTSSAAKKKLVTKGKPLAKPAKSKVSTQSKQAKLKPAKSKPAKMMKSALAKSSSKAAKTGKPTTAKGPSKAESKKSDLNKIDWANFLVPLDDRLIVDVEAGEKVTTGGIIIPDTAQAEGNFKGRVLVVGRGHRDEKGRVRPMDVKSGDKVLFPEFAGTKIKVMDRQVLILRESDILGILA